MTTLQGRRSSFLGWLVSTRDLISGYLHVSACICNHLQSSACILHVSGSRIKHEIPGIGCSGKSQGVGVGSLEKEDQASAGNLGQRETLTSVESKLATTAFIDPVWLDLCLHVWGLPPYVSCQRLLECAGRLHVTDSICPAMITVEGGAHQGPPLCRC